MVDSIPFSINTTLPLESETDTTPVLLVTLDYSTHGSISPISIDPPPSNEVISFDWSRLTELRPPSSTPPLSKS